MAIWRRCSKRTCANPRRCLEHLYFDVTHRGRRYRVPANKFAIPRMEQVPAHVPGREAGGSQPADGEVTEVLADAEPAPE